MRALRHGRSPGMRLLRRLGFRRSTIEAAPFPVFRPAAQTGVDGVQCGVSATARRVNLIADQMVVGFGLPKRLADTLQPSIRFIGRIGFPTVQNPAQCLRRSRPDDHVHMVWHHYPGTELVTLLIEMPQSIRNQIRDVRPLEVACAMSGVQLRIHANRIPTEQFLLLVPS